MCVEFFLLIKYKKFFFFSQGFQQLCCQAIHGGVRDTERDVLPGGWQVASPETIDSEALAFANKNVPSFSLFKLYLTSVFA